MSCASSWLIHFHPHYPMKAPLLIVICSTVLLAACSQDVANTPQTEEKTLSEVLALTEQCKEYGKTVYDIAEWEQGSIEYFYSPSKDTCIAVERQTLVQENGEIKEDFFVFDVRH